MHYTDSTAAPPPAGLERAALVTLVLIVSLFFLWGMANNLNDILIKQFKKAFELSDFQAGLVQSAFYLGYFLLAIPAGVCMRRFGYKGALLTGLALYAAGAFLFYPAAAQHAYGLFLLALFVIASGLAFLETSANPLVTVLGPPQSAAFRLNLAQSFNPLGSITGVLVGKHFIFSGVEHTPAELAVMAPAAREAYYAAESAAVQTPYLVIGAIVVLWAVLIARSRFPATADHAADSGSGVRHIGRLLRNGHFVFAVVAQFFYVGAQVGIWSYLIRYIQGTLPGTPEKSAADFLLASLFAFVLGRFAGTALMRVVAPVRLLAIFAAINMALCAVAIALPGWSGVYALVAASFFMSVMFPTIFATGLSGLDDDDRKLGSSFLVMAIIGGAVLTALMGAVSDASGIHLSMIVPALCFAAVLAFALRDMHGVGR
ncbi:MAG: L-fucose:H+ symporter permease [Proteobacteria bacterium]|nr:L-fucose:H+ symporter permease [Pseudomonadota bacterium]